MAKCDDRCSQRTEAARLKAEQDHFNVSTDDKTKSKIIKNDSLSDINFPTNVIKEEPIWDQSYENYELPLEPELELQEIKMEEN